MARTLVIILIFSACFIACGEVDTPVVEQEHVKPVLSTEVGFYKGTKAYLVNVEADRIIDALIPIKHELLGKQEDVNERGAEALPIHFSIYVNDGLKVSAWLNMDYNVEASGFFIEEFFHDIEFTEVAPVALHDLSNFCFIYNEPLIPACKPYMH